MNRNIPSQRKASSAVIVALLVATLFAAVCHATEPQTRPAANPLDITAEVRGKGRPVLTIPGLNSHASVWHETCDAMPDVQCHVLQLPGFAGATAIESETFLDEMARQTLAYARQNQLHQPAVMGHSLGGLLALKLALAEPESVGPLIIVDSLPFFAAAMNPTATVDSITPMANAMRQQMLASDDASYQQQAAATMQTMSRVESRMEELKQWGADSDRATTTQAMYELMTTDLRDDISAIRSPTLVLGAWAAYAAYGQTQEATRKIFETQYAALPGIRIEISEAGYHFLMWDDPQWLRQHVGDFLKAHPVPEH